MFSALHRSSFFVFVAIVGLSGSALAGDAWTEDLAAAKAQAEKENKDLLLDFTGSDWCIWCKRLHAEVLNLESFQSAAQKKFVLVELDYPRAKPQPAETRKQNEALRRQFAITTYPSIFLTDAKGRPYARTSYAAGGPEKYMESLEALRKQKESRDAALSKAEKARDLERAKFLDEALTGLIANDIRVGYDDLMQEVEQLDKDNSAGLKKKYELVLAYNEVMSGMNDNDIAGLLVKTEKLLTENNPALTGENRQELYFLKANILASQKDMPNAIKALNEAKAAAPQSEKAQLIDQILTNIAAHQPQPAK